MTDAETMAGLFSRFGLAPAMQAALLASMPKARDAGMFKPCGTTERPAGAAEKPCGGQERTPRRPLPVCVHRGPVNYECHRDERRHIYWCHHDQADWSRCWHHNVTNADDDVQSCYRCPWHDDGTTPTVGVAIGSYNLPKLIELQVRLIRRHCGDVPILIVDDCSDGYGHTPSKASVCGRLRTIAATYESVYVFIHPTRLGHASGDLSKAWMGLQWAHARGIRVLACLSQRLLIDRPRWLQQGAQELLRSGLATASQPCIEGKDRFPIRSEAMLLDVERWHTPAILDHLTPRRMTPVPGEWGVAAEYVYWHDIRDRLDGTFHRWSLFGPDRGRRYRDVVWHCSHTRDDYHQLAQKNELELDRQFSCNGWRALQGAGYQG